MRSISVFCLSSFSLCLPLNSSLSLRPSPPSVSPVRSSLIRNSPPVCACVCVCVRARECVYEFCSTGMMHLVYPISLKTLFSFVLFPPLSLRIWLYNTTGSDTTQHSFNRSRHVRSQSVYRLVLCFCGSRVARWIELKTLQSSCAVRVLFLFSLYS